MNYIFIDGSYFIFYRYFALIQWWKKAHVEEPLDNLIDNDEFCNKFISRCKDSIKEIKKNLKLPKETMVYIAFDCPRRTIWRTKIFHSYKASRPNYNKESHLNPGPFFKLIYKSNIFQEIGCSILQEPELEADDCIALTIKKIKTDENKCYIIASDHDYFQILESDKIMLYDLKFKQVNTEKNSFLDAKKDLFVKCVIGDKSDNISGIFPKNVGRKTADKYYEDKELFKNKCNTPQILQLYARNKLLIDFNMIPNELQERFYENNVLNE